MMMIVDTSNSDTSFNKLTEQMKILGEDIGVKIRLQHENIFEKMHRL